VVATKDGNALGISDFESYEESDSFYGVVTSINIITHEEVVGIWVWAPNSEQLHQVMKLAMDISAHSDWAFHWLYIRLVPQDLSCLLAQPLHVNLR